MSKNRQYLERYGWRLFSRRKHGMYIKESWFHPRDGSKTFNQESAVQEQRRLNGERKQRSAIVNLRHDILDQIKAKETA